MWFVSDYLLVVLVCYNDFFKSTRRCYISHCIKLTLHSPSTRKEIRFRGKCLILNMVRHESQRKSVVRGIITSIRQSSIFSKNIIDETLNEEDIGAPNCLLKDTGEVKLLQPLEFCDNPQLQVSDGKRRVLSPGNIRFANAASCLLLRDQLWAKVVSEPELQSQQWENDSKSKGLIRLRIWNFDQWVDIYVNDELPTLNTNNVLTHFESHRNELWLPFLEKAMAKRYGSYEKMASVSIEEFFEDLTGGICEYYKSSAGNLTVPAETINTWYSTLDDELNRGSVITCGTFHSDLTLPSGLHHKRLYAITRVFEVCLLDTASETTKLVCLRNMWGDNSEWVGVMSKTSNEWSSLSHAIRKKLEHGLNREDFWMPVEDMCINFDTFYICRVATNLEDEKKPQWFEKVGVSTWPWKGKEKYQGLKEPQFIFDVVRDSEDDDEEEVVIQVTRTNSGIIVSHESTIDAALYLVERNREVRMFDLTFQNKVETSLVPSNRRSNIIRCKLRDGRYAVVPECKGAHELKDDIVVRVLTKGNYFFKELTKEAFKTKVSCGPVCVQKKHAKLATRVTLVSAVDLTRCEDLPPNARFHCVISCEEQMIKTRQITFPTFREFGLIWDDESAMFYRYKPEKKFINFDFYSDLDSSTKVGHYTHKNDKDIAGPELYRVHLDEDLGKITFKVHDITPLSNDFLLA